MLLIREPMPALTGSVDALTKALPHCAAVYDDVRDQISTEITVGAQPNIAYCYPDHVAMYNLAQAVQTLDSYIDSAAVAVTADGS